MTVHTVSVSGVGSLMNALYRQTQPPEPAEGMGATILMWTDRHACTIVRVSRDKKCVWVERDKAIFLGETILSEHQHYRYERGESRGSECYTLRKNGRWVRRGEPMKNGTSLLIGVRKEYRDPSF